MNLTQLPDLARMRALAVRVRGLSAVATLDFLATEDGQWLFTECSPYLDSDVRVKLTKALCSGLPPGVVTKVLFGGDEADHA